jgi:hypothetical protein
MLTRRVSPPLERALFLETAVALEEELEPFPAT